jgi:hypothetical protein
VRTIPVRGRRAVGRERGQSGVFRVDHQLPIVIRDINGDRFPDFVATHVGRGATHVFLGNADRTELRTPSQIVKVDGFAVLNSVLDLDGDEREDLIVATVPKIGLWGALKIFITRSITAEAHVFYNRGKELFPLIADYRREIEVPLIARKGARMAIGTRLVVTAKADMDGDGIRDLVLRTGEDRLGIFPGRRGQGFADEPSEEIFLSPDEEEAYQAIVPRAEDLDGDGRGDLLLTYRGWDRDDDRLEVFLSSAR